MRVSGLNPGARERAAGDNRKGESRVCHDFVLPAHVPSLPADTGRGPRRRGIISSDFAGRDGKIRRGCGGGYSLARTHQAL
jgi:hypothetical protein